MYRNTPPGSDVQKQFRLTAKTQLGNIVYNIIKAADYGLIVDTIKVLLPRSSARSHYQVESMRTQIGLYLSRQKVVF